MPGLLNPKCEDCAHRLAEVLQLLLVNSRCICGKLYSEQGRTHCR